MCVTVKAQLLVIKHAAGHSEIKQVLFKQLDTTAYKGQWVYKKLGEGDDIRIKNRNMLHLPLFCYYVA